MISSSVIPIDTLQVTVPSTPLPWWITSNVSKWRYRIDIEGIKNANPQDLGIFDWKVLFEIALRDPTSIWRLSPSISLGQDVIPILGSIQEIDFVTNKAVFRLHGHTVSLLLKHHAELIRQLSHIPLRHAAVIADTFRRRLDVLQVKLSAVVISCTDGNYARGDFPAYASTPGANKDIVRMLDLALKGNGLRRILLDAFFDLSPSIPSLIEDSLGSSSPGSRSLIKTPSSVLSGLPSKPYVSPTETIFPYNELQTLICQKPSNQKPEHDDNNLVSNASSRKRKRELHPPAKATNRRRRANIIEDERGGKRRKPSNNNKALERIKVSLKTLKAGPICRKLSSVATECLERSTCEEPWLGDRLVNSGTQIAPHTPAVTTKEKAMEQFASQKSRPRQKSHIRPSPENALNCDELAIFNMDSSFAPVTRRQAAFNFQAIQRSEGTSNTTIFYNIGEDSDETEDEDGNGGTRPQRSKPFNRFLTRLMEPGKMLEKRQTGALPKVLKRPRRDSTSEERDWEDSTDSRSNSDYSSSNDSPGDGSINTTNSDESTMNGSSRECSIRSAFAEENKPLSTQDDNYTDEDDLILDSDTPDIELLTDSADEEDHRHRKLRRLERKRLKRGIQVAEI
ncbi:hypothetical protein ABW19_dt0208805 [Dactylella cylindrospora]|nr:hypothetical protein ABW19_dt0208805 [Dactylella cylindrospora]